MYAKFGQEVSDVIEAIRSEKDLEDMSWIKAFYNLPAEILILVLQDSDIRVRGLAAVALSNIQDSKYIEPLLEAALKETQPGIFMSILIILRNFKDARVKKLFVDFLRAAPPQNWLVEEVGGVRGTAALLLGDIGDEGCLPLLEYLEKNDKGTSQRGAKVKDAARQAINKIKSK